MRPLIAVLLPLLSVGCLLAQDTDPKDRKVSVLNMQLTSRELAHEADALSEFVGQAGQSDARAVVRHFSQASDLQDFVSRVTSAGPEAGEKSRLVRQISATLDRAGHPLTEWQKAELAKHTLKSLEFRARQAPDDLLALIPLDRNSLARLQK